MENTTNPPTATQNRESNGAPATPRDEEYRRRVADAAARHPGDIDGQLQHLRGVGSVDAPARLPRCAFTNAYAELPDPEHTGHAVARAQKDWLRTHLSRLATEAGARRPDSLAEQLLVLHEGAIIAFSAGGNPDATTSAAQAAATLLHASRT